MDLNPPIQIWKYWANSTMNKKIHFFNCWQGQASKIIFAKFEKAPAHWIRHEKLLYICWAGEEIFPREKWHAQWIKNSQLNWRVKIVWRCKRKRSRLLCTFLRITLLTMNSLQIAPSLSQSTFPNTNFSSFSSALAAASKIGWSWRENLGVNLRDCHLNNNQTRWSTKEKSAIFLIKRN